MFLGTVDQILYDAGPLKRPKYWYFCGKEGSSALDAFIINSNGSFDSDESFLK